MDSIFTIWPHLRVLGRFGKFAAPSGFGQYWDKRLIVVGSLEGSSFCPAFAFWRDQHIKI